MSSAETNPSAPMSGTTTGIPLTIPLRRESTSIVESSNLLPYAVSLPIILLGLAVYLVYRRRRGFASDKDAVGEVPEARGFGNWTKWLKPSARSELKVVASTRLTPRHSLHELHWNGNQILIGCTGESMAVLATHPCTDTNETSLQVGDPRCR